jgi:hypothetical protein
MAVVSATVRAVTFALGPFDQTSGGTDLRVVNVYFDSAGVTVTGGTDTLDVAALGTTIAANARDGKTYTPRAFSLIQGYRTGTSNVYGTVALATAALRLTPTTSDFSTAATVTGSNPVDAPFGVSVTCVVT